MPRNVIQVCSFRRRKRGSCICLICCETSLPKLIIEDRYTDSNKYSDYGDYDQEFSKGEALLILFHWASLPLS